MRTNYGTKIIQLSDVWAINGDKSEIPSLDEGYTDEYTGSVFPDRTHLNDILCRLSAIGYDVNKYGAMLPWDVGVSFGQGAHVVGSDLRMYRSNVSDNAGSDPTATIGGNRINVPSLWIDVEEETIGNVPTSGLLVDYFVYNAQSSNRTDIGSAISGSVDQQVEFGSIFNARSTFGTKNLTGTKSLSKDREYIVEVDINFSASFPSKTGYYSKYAVKPSDCSSYPLRINSSTAKYGGAGYGYQFSPYGCSGAFYYKPVNDGLITLNIVNQGNQNQGIGATVRIFER